MDFDDIEKVLALVKEHELTEFELERDGLKLKVKKAQAGGQGQPMMPMMSAPMPAMQFTGAPSAPPTTSHATPSAPPDDELELAVVKSPIVGTFYRSAEPGAASFVEVGQRVKKDQVLCIIEAMKLMNEITSEFDGELVSAYVENGKPVQYGERLFAIKTS
ncbi:MAG: acetyl-CoA carboxylase biotin carboxyl carrier protein [Acidobacteriota bacterium]|nr:acetyl-CoA carboxylase biotin carboxyl carrier protein [Acidobacteriota bacterium]MDQ3420493.1 acetyl-CoA carboxylase biotin carboxyl carrier protein [Acidobacteriota bacterium]